MTDQNNIREVLKEHQGTFHPVVPFDPQRDRLYPFDFTSDNKELRPEQIADTENFANYINQTLRAHGARYGIGGYGEHRTLYARSRHFDTGEEPRRLHLGIDIWGPAGTAVMAPLDGIVHSFAFNNNDSDYGATLILTHHAGGVGFQILYGHLSLNSLKNLHEGKRVSKGEVIAEFGMRFENGNWPPHLHFQLIIDMEGWKGDYPGVCKFSEREKWMANCPDPDLVLGMMRYVV
ncbi:MAG: peptidoglycan DD-metalloendopeptidase family protein [Chitinophagaceae bacterium]|nr:peptidoglycan DD-metalloendopeptidase family protein [Chitinophagaceae bacterium]